MQVHPVSLGIFNFVNAWSMMFWPVMLADKKGQAVKQRFPLWFGTQATLSFSVQLPFSPGQCIPRDAYTGFFASKLHALGETTLSALIITYPLPVQFLTNVFFIPYMAVRQFESKTKPNLAAPGCDPKRLPPYASVLAVVGVIVGVATFFWMPLAHPEYGSIADRYALSHCVSLSPAVFLPTLGYPHKHTQHSSCLSATGIWSPPATLACLNMIPLQVGFLSGGMHPQQGILRICAGHGALLCLSVSIAGKCTSSVPVHTILWPGCMAHRPQ